PLSLALRDGLPIFFFWLRQVGEWFIAAYIQSSDHERTILTERLANGLILNALFGLGGSLTTLHEEELRTQEAHAIATFFDRCFSVFGASNIGSNFHLETVDRGALLKSPLHRLKS